MALTTIKTNSLPDDAVTSAKIADDAITSALIADDAVDQARVADEAIDEARIQISNAGSNGQFLQKQSGNTGGLTWADGASEGTEVKSTGVSGTSSYLRADGDGTSSWQTVSSVGGATGVDFNDNVKARFGTGNDLEIYHDGTNNTIKCASNNDTLLLLGDSILIKDQDNSDSFIRCTADGNVELYYDNSKKLETTSLGVNVTGDQQWSVDGAGADELHWDASAATLGFKDNIKALFGSGDDMHLYHDGTNSWIVNKTGNLGIYAKHGEYGAIIKPDAGVELYYDNNKKFETTSAGVTITGDLTVTGTPPVASIGTSGNYTGSHVCLGTSAGAYASSNYKICIGYQAGQYGTGRHNNTFIGVNAGRGNSDGTSSTGDSNCCIGDYAGEDLTSGSSNTLIGPNAGKDVTSGNSNVIIGYAAGNTANDIHGTVIMGPSSGYGLDESNYSVIIGHGASGETLQGNAADNQLFIARQGYGGGNDGTWIYGNSSGQCQQGGGSSSWYTGSDERYKDFLGKYSRGLAAINALDVQNFKWKDKDKMPDIAFNNAGSYCGPTIDGKIKIGVGAQSCEKVIPEAVNKLEPCELEKGGNHMLTLDNDPIFWAMVNAIQELSAKVTALENA